MRNTFYSLLLIFKTNIKKDLTRGEECPHGIVLRRRHSHTGREIPRTPAPPVHSGPSPVRKAEPLLCFGYETDERIFFVASRESNSRAAGSQLRAFTSRAKARLLKADRPADAWVVVCRWAVDSIRFATTPFDWARFRPAL